MKKCCDCFTCKCYRAFQAGELTKHEYDCLILGYYFGQVSALKPVREHFKNPKSDDDMPIDEYVDMSYDACADGLGQMMDCVIKKYKKFVEGTSF